MSKQYLYRVEILNKKNHHPLDSIAHYCGENQYDINNSKTYESNSNSKVIWNNILTPTKETDFQSYVNLPDYLKFRSHKPDIISNARNILWKNVDSRETRADSQFARIFELAIPSFLNEGESIKLIKSFSNILISEGMIIDASLHNHTKKSDAISLLETLKFINNTDTKDNEEDQNQDYTAFLMSTLRDYSKGQFVNKNRAWNDRDKMKEWRRDWLNLLQETINKSEANEELKSAWNKKLSIYPENQDNKNKLFFSSSSVNKL